MGTPLTLAETASVFGEQIVFGRLLEQADTPESRLSLLTETIDGAVATVFRQIAMNRFEHLVHTERREQGELAVERFGELWIESQSELLGDAVKLTDNYAPWWSYVPHFIGSPGYVYAYAYGQLLALAVYGRYEAEGEAFVPAYLDLLAAGGSLSPEELGRSSASTSPTRASGTSASRSSTASSRRPRPRRARPGGARPGRAGSAQAATPSAAARSAAMSSLRILNIASIARRARSGSSSPNSSSSRRARPATRARSGPCTSRTGPPRRRRRGAPSSGRAPPGPRTRPGTRPPR